MSPKRSTLIKRCEQNTEKAIAMLQVQADGMREMRALIGAQVGLMRGMKERSDIQTALMKEILKMKPGSIQVSRVEDHPNSSSSTRSPRKTKTVHVSRFLSPSQADHGETLKLMANKFLS